MSSTKSIYVSFGEKKAEQNFEALKEGKFQDKQLHSFISRAISDMKKNASCGIKLPKKLWPKPYVDAYSLTNLWKYDLPNGWRLIYTIKENEVLILNVILEWFSHKEYKRKFGY